MVQRDPKGPPADKGVPYTICVTGELVKSLFQVSEKLSSQSADWVRRRFLLASVPPFTVAFGLPRAPPALARWSSLLPALGVAPLAAPAVEAAVTQHATAAGGRPNGRQWRT